MPHLDKSSTLQIHRAHYLNEVSGRQNKGELLCPIGHRRYGGEQATEQHKNNDKEEHDKHRLLYVVRLVGYCHSKARETKYKEDCSKIDIA